jgi:hypothetical protein
MKPEHFAGQTNVLGAPPSWDASAMGPCHDLPVQIVNCPVSGISYSSHWKPSWREAFGLLIGKRIELHVCGISHPPVSLAVVPHARPQEP